MGPLDNPGKGDNRRPTNERKVAENWPSGLGPPNGRVKRFHKVYGENRRASSKLTLIGVERKGEPKVIVQDLMADYLKEQGA